MQKGQLVLLGKSGTDLFEEVASEFKHDTSGLLHMAYGCCHWPTFKGLAMQGTINKH